MDVPPLGVGAASKLVMNPLEASSLEDLTEMADIVLRQPIRGLPRCESEDPPRARRSKRPSCGPRLLGQPVQARRIYEPVTCNSMRRKAPAVNQLADPLRADTQATGSVYDAHSQIHRGILPQAQVLLRYNTSSAPSIVESSGKQSYELRAGPVSCA
jgi:hypothetical protein